MTIAYLVLRSLQSLLLIFLATLVVFLLLHITPGDPATLILGDQATPEQVADLRRSMGLDRPLHAQYGRFLTHAVRGDFGLSIRAQQPALSYVLARLPATLQLSAGAFAFAVLTGIPLGMLAAMKRLSLWDHGSMFVALLGQSMPVYWLGLMLIVIFAVHLRWLPASGMGQLQHLVLPAFTLGMFLIGLIIRLMRSNMLDVLNRDYIRTAHAKGLSQHIVL